MLEWLTLPQMVMAAAGALNHAGRLFSTIEVNEGQMRANLDQSNGQTLAEAAVFALSAHMPKPEAQELVKQACTESRRTRVHVVDILIREVDVPIDWEKLKDPGRYTGMAGGQGIDGSSTGE